MFLETICIVDGIVQNAKAHKERMRRTADHLGFSLPPPSEWERFLSESRKFISEYKKVETETETDKFVPKEEELLSKLIDLLPQNLQQGKVKCRIIYRETIKEITFERYHPKKVRSLKLIESSLNYAFKFADRASLNALLSQKGECDEILITRNGLITDTSYSNVVFNKGEQYFTPKSPLLNGTKRQKLLREGKIKEKEIAVDTLGQYDRVHLINAMLDLADDISLPVDYIQI